MERETQDFVQKGKETVMMMNNVQVFLNVEPTTVLQHQVELSRILFELLKKVVCF